MGIAPFCWFRIILACGRRLNHGAAVAVCCSTAEDVTPKQMAGISVSYNENLDFQMKKFKGYVANLLRERVLHHYLIPYSRHGLDPALVRWWKPGGAVTVVDVGASSGAFMEAVAKHFQVKRALLVEPLPNRCEELRCKYKEPVYSVHQCALANAEGSQTLKVLDFDYATSLLPVAVSSNSFDESWSFEVCAEVNCPVTTLDALLAQTGLLRGPIDLLKVDVQGAEGRLLEGAVAALPVVKYLYCEVSFRPLYEGSAVFADVYQSLADAGFRLLQIDEGVRTKEGELVQADALFANTRAR